MSGIAAAIRLDGAPVDRTLVDAMIAALAHRGTDGSGAWSDGPAALGATMRATTAEAVSEAQPLVDRDSGAVLVFDGYLANFDELRAMLGAASDAGLVLAAYRRWGDDFASHLDGEFAAVLWDPKRRALFAVRDPIGNRPLAWHCDGRTLLVASEHAAILAALPRHPEPNRAYLAQVLADTFLCAEDTPWEGIRRIPAAHVLRAENGSVREERYWEPDLDARIVHRRDADYEGDYRALLFDCTRRAARSHARTAFHVSGGLDSSALFCAANQMVADGSLPTPAIAGFALASPPGSDADEDRYVVAVERHTGRRIARVPLTLPPLDLFVSESRAALDVPPYPNTVVIDGMTDAVVAAESRVVVSGLGGDNWLDGQPTYYGEDLAAARFAAVIASLRGDLREIGAKATTRRFARSVLPRVVPKPMIDALRKLTGHRRAHALDGLDWLTHGAMELLLDRLDRRTAFLGRYPRHLRYKVAKLTSPEVLHGLAGIERQVALHGAELRSPMFGKAFIAFSLATPERLRRQGDRYKIIHRRALTGIVPDEVLERPGKAHFDLAYHRLFPEIAKTLGSPLPPAVAALVGDPGHGLGLSRQGSLLDDPPIRPVWSFYAAILLAQSLESDRRKPATT